MSMREVNISIAGINLGLAIEVMLHGDPAWVWIINLMAALTNIAAFLAQPRGEA